MSLFDIIYTILIGPLQLIFEIIFAVAHRFIGHPGLAIIVLSLIMNFLVLPLYRRADAMQEEARDIDLKLSKGVKHIKKSFTGDERMMILQAYYRQNNYKPTDALNGSVSLLLEIPFFMAAYQFLSHLNILHGVSLGPISDLGVPDGLIHIGGLTLNLLPILMTTINVISSAIYLKGFPVKTKVQLYAMSAFFLVFLYKSPAGLVFYWTLNNLFSLAKTIFYKLKNPRKVLGIMFSVVGLIIGGYGLFVYDNPSIRRELFVVALGVVLQAPLLVYIFGGKVKAKEEKKLAESKAADKSEADAASEAGKKMVAKKTTLFDKGFFLAGAVLLTVLVGMLIPSALMASSPQDFVDVMNFYNPLWYVAYALCLSAGTFLVWFRVFYWLASPAGKNVFDKLIWIMCAVMTVNYLFFGTKLGMISPTLQFEDGLVFRPNENLINALVMVAIIGVTLLVVSKWKKPLKSILTILVIALIGMSVMNVSKIQKSVANAKENIKQLRADEEIPQFTLSKEGKNVVVLMLDRGLGFQIPYIFAEKPELKEKFDGFTHYSNVISYGGVTNFGAPALFGGYEYTPLEMNKRDTEPLKDKHNEALKVMPVMFDEAGYEVTVCDPPYANYQVVPDLSIYDDYPDIATYVTDGYFADKDGAEAKRDTVKRNFFCYSIMKTMPVFAQDMVYNYGKYNYADEMSEDVILTGHVAHNTAQAEGLAYPFVNAYTTLQNMSTMTTIEEGEVNTFMMMNNNLPHEQTLLQKPDYTPAMKVDNTAYEAEHPMVYEIDGVNMDMNSVEQVKHYHVNMATMLLLGDWFDYLREQGVYDNTRIIIVSDHGRPTCQLDELLLDEEYVQVKDATLYYPLLLVKDFNSEGFTTSDEFMTNGDVPTMATAGLIENPTNPFTGKAINNDAKYAGEQYVFMSLDWEVEFNNGNQFKPGTWYKVKDNIWEKENWTYIDEVTARPDEVE